MTEQGLCPSSALFCPKDQWMCAERMREDVRVQSLGGGIMKGTCKEVTESHALGGERSRYSINAGHGWEGRFGPHPDPPQAAAGSTGAQPLAQVPSICELQGQLSWGPERRSPRTLGGDRRSPGALSENPHLYLPFLPGLLAVHTEQKCERGGGGGCSLAENTTSRDCQV